MGTLETRELTEWPEQIPPEWVDRIRRCEEGGTDPTPLKRQCLFSPEEMSPQPSGFSANPLEEQTGTALLKKYAGRALILTESGCAMRCRFCFRRHTRPHSSVPHSPVPRLPVPSPDSGFSGRFRDAVRRIAEDPDCHEVILSGGDPLTQSGSLLTEEYRQFAGVPHVRRLRIHTRIPVIAPRLMPDPTFFRRWFPRITTVMVLHVNHPLEIDPGYGSFPSESIASLSDAGIPVLSQTTLLRGVNDSADTLAELLERLVDLRVIPYYLHQLDRVRGAAHFEVPVDQGRRILEELRIRLPGYAVPRYVREIPGLPYKHPLERWE